MENWRIGGRCRNTPNGRGATNDENGHQRQQHPPTQISKNRSQTHPRQPTAPHQLSTLCTTHSRPTQTQPSLRTSSTIQQLRCLTGIHIGNLPTPLEGALRTVGIEDEVTMEGEEIWSFGCGSSLRRMRSAKSTPSMA